MRNTLITNVPDNTFAIGELRIRVKRGINPQNKFTTNAKNTLIYIEYKDGFKVFDTLWDSSKQLIIAVKLYYISPTDEICIPMYSNIGEDAKDVLRLICQAYDIHLQIAYRNRWHTSAKEALERDMPRLSYIAKSKSQMTKMDNAETIAQEIEILTNPQTDSESVNIDTTESFQDAVM